MNGQLSNVFNRRLDKLVRPEIHLFRLTRSAYLFCGYGGLLMAVLLAMFLATFLRLSAWVMAAKIITDEQNIIYQRTM